METVAIHVERGYISLFAGRPASPLGKFNFFFFSVPQQLAVFWGFT